jgi:hypothetical protein
LPLGNDEFRTDRSFFAETLRERYRIALIASDALDKPVAPVYNCPPIAKNCGLGVSLMSLIAGEAGLSRERRNAHEAAHRPFPPHVWRFSLVASVPQLSALNSRSQGPNQP